MSIGGNTTPPKIKRVNPNPNWLCHICFDDRPGYMINCPECYSPRPY